MAEIWRGGKKSDLRPKYNPPNGVDVHFGDKIIFESDGKTYIGICQGWRLVDEQALVKTDLFNDMAFRVDVPIENVWRVWDARDDRIEELEWYIEQNSH